MKVIHDNELGGIAMIPLISDWGIQQTCQVIGCEEKTSTLILKEEVLVSLAVWPETIGVTQRAENL